VNFSITTQASLNLQANQIAQNAVGAKASNSQPVAQIPADASTGGSSLTSVHGSVAGVPKDLEKLKETVASLNKQLESTQTQVVFANNQPANQVWLNVVDKTSGKVLYEVPAESVRNLESTGVNPQGSAALGLVLDKRL